MNSPATKNKFKRFSRPNLYAAFASVASLAATFWVSNADYSFRAKTTIFVGIVVTYLIFYTSIYIWQRQSPDEVSVNNADFSFDSEIEENLLALEETSRFFGASLKFADVFRLVTSRTHTIVPYAACALYLADDKKERLHLASAVGDDLQQFVGTDIDSQKGFAGQTFQRRAAQSCARLSEQTHPVAAEISVNLKSAIAVPLMNGADVFGVFALYGNRENDFDSQSIQFLEAVGTRVAPLFLSSKAFESSLNNALTDTLTALPNERAFYLVLENQIAESQRYRDARPLTVLTMDIVDFTKHNRRLGHANGDRLLVFAAERIKNQLRQMDFLARSANDEFLAVLPTASEEIAREIVGRITKTFVVNPFEASAREKIHLQISFGAASFGKDGEAAGQLLQRAILRKQESKSKNPDSKILWFPKEYVN